LIPADAPVTAWLRVIEGDAVAVVLSDACPTTGRVRLRARSFCRTNGVFWTVQPLYRIVLGAAALCAVALPVVLLLGVTVAAGPLVIAFFTCFAIGSRGSRIVRDFAFTIWIFAAVSTSMFYPQYFLTIGEFRLSRLIVPLIQVIMFGMGTALSISDFSNVLKMPRAVLVGMVCQFSIMPLLGFTLAILFGFPDEIAAGVVLIGSAPGGVASNVMAYIAGASLPLSVTLTTFSTLMSPVMTPLAMKLLAGQFVPVDFFEMMMGIIRMILVPLTAGLLFNRIFRGRAQWLHRAMPLVSMAGIAVIITIITAAGRDALLEVGAALILAAMIHNAAGYVLGYWGARLVRLDERACRTVAIEVGMQNGGLASGIALQMGKVATVGLAPAIFGPWMNISGSMLANYWRRTAETELVLDAAEEIGASVTT
jgi:BASS family bile acid:Na+ symporter